VGVDQYLAVIFPVPGADIQDRHTAKNGFSDGDTAPFGRFLVLFVGRFPFGMGLAPSFPIIGLGKFTFVDLFFTEIFSGSVELPGRW